MEESMAEVTDFMIRVVIVTKITGKPYVGHVWFD